MNSAPLDNDIGVLLAVHNRTLRINRARLEPHGRRAGATLGQLPQAIAGDTDRSGWLRVQQRENPGGVAHESMHAPRRPVHSRIRVR